MLTFVKLVSHYDQERNRYDEKIDDVTDLTELAYGRTACICDHGLIRVLSTYRRRIAQDDQTTDEEHKRNL